MATVVFDLGGVLLNWQPVSLVQQVWPHLATHLQQAHTLVQGVFQSFSVGSDWASFDRGTAEPAEVAQSIAHRLGLSPDEVMRLIEAIPAHLTTLDDTVSLLTQLKAAGHRLHYLSNMPMAYADDLERERAFFDHFDSGVFSCRLRLIKPEPAIFQAAEQQFHAQPGQTWFIDDVAHNIAAAQQHGWHGIQFMNAGQCGAALRDAGLM